jgi:hypothetical protein
MRKVIREGGDKEEHDDWMMMAFLRGSTDQEKIVVVLITPASAS